MITDDEYNCQVLINHIIAHNMKERRMRLHRDQSVKTGQCLCKPSSIYSGVIKLMVGPKELHIVKVHRGEGMPLL